MASERAAPSSPHRVVFSTVTVTLVNGEPSGAGVAVDADRALHRLPLSDEAPGRRAVGGADQLGLGPALEGEGLARTFEAGMLQVERGQVHDAVDRLVPGDVASPVDLEGVDGTVEGFGAGCGAAADHRLDAASLGLQAPEADVQDPVHLARPHVDEAFGARRPPLRAVELAVGPWHEDTPLEPHLVLPRGRPVGVEDVALVEHGVGHGARRGEAVLVGTGRDRGRAQRAARAAHGRPSSASPASLRSCANAWSHVGRPRRALKRCRSSSVSRPSRMYALAG